MQILRFAQNDRPPKERLACLSEHSKGSRSEECYETNLTSPDSGVNRRLHKVHVLHAADKKGGDQGQGSRLRRVFREPQCGSERN